MSFVENMLKVADRLIAKYGSDITLQEVTTGVYSPDTGLVDEVVVDHAVKAHIANYTNDQLVKDVINIDDIRVLVYVAQFEIDKKWRILYDGEEYTILNIRRVTAQSKKIIYELQCRGRNVS